MQTSLANTNNRSWIIHKKIYWQNCFCAHHFQHRWWKHQRIFMESQHWLGLKGTLTNKGSTLKKNAVLRHYQNMHYSLWKPSASECVCRGLCRALICLCSGCFSGDAWPEFTRASSEVPVVYFSAVFYLSLIIVFKPSSLGGCRQGFARGERSKQ